jgi:hypothetical protein
MYYLEIIYVKISQIFPKVLLKVFFYTFFVFARSFLSPLGKQSVNVGVLPLQLLAHGFLQRLATCFVLPLQRNQVTCCIVGTATLLIYKASAVRTRVAEHCRVGAIFWTFCLWNKLDVGEYSYFIVFRYRGHVSLFPV